jgi:hypothetical protein
MGTSSEAMLRVLIEEDRLELESDSFGSWKMSQDRIEAVARLGKAAHDSAPTSHAMS